MDQIAVTLIKNAAFLLAMMIVFDLFISRRLDHSRWHHQALAGALLGVLTIGLMISSFQLQIGVFFDLRSVLLSLTGLFFGPIATLFAMAIATIFRLWQGGAGMLVGIATILASGIIGIIWRHYRHKRLKDISVKELYGFGLMVQLAVTANYLLLPWDIVVQVFGAVVVPSLLLFPFVTIALGQLLVDRLQREHSNAILAVKEMRYRSVFESASVGKAMILLTGEIDVNHAFCDMLGYSFEELQGKNWQTLVPSEDIDFINERMAPLISGEKTKVRFEKRYLHKNGSFVWTDFSATMERDKEGKPLYFIVTVVDITGRKRAEEWALESDSRFALAQELSPDGFTILQPIRNDKAEIIDFIWKYENAAIARINGTDPEKVIGQRLLDLFPEHRETPVFQAYRHVARTGETHVIEEICVQDILSKPIWLRLVIVSMGADIAIFTENITERKLMEETLRLRVERSAALLELTKLTNYSEKDFMQRGMEIVEKLTCSKISFIHFLNENEEDIELVAWSRNTLEHYCTAAYDSHYPVSKAGIWADALRERRPVVFNDYPSYPHKKGLPEGHSEMKRLISVPVLHNGRVVVLAGVGNKNEDYTSFDIETVQLFTNTIWNVVKEARTSSIAREASERLEKLAIHVPGTLYQFHLSPDGSMKLPYASKGIENIYGVLPEQVVNDATAVFENIHPDDIAQLKESIQESARTLADWSNLHRVNFPDGRTIWVEGEATPIANTDGSILWHGYARDVTESRESTASLELMNTQLLEGEKKLQESLSGAVSLLSVTVEARDPYTAGHQHNVSLLATAIAEEMGLAENRIRGLELAAEIHDLGKISVPAEILSKPTRLNPIEFELIKMHPQTGYDILKNIEFPWPIAQMVYQHHERMDGSGYPRGLKGEEILLEARIIAVADVIEAMASHRPYRPGLGIDTALAEIERNRGAEYDSAVVDACLRLFREKNYKLEA